MYKRKICAAFLAVVMTAASLPLTAQSAKLPDTPPPVYTVPEEKPVVDGLACGDAAHADSWSIRQDLAAGDQVYSDADAAFTEIPAALAGSVWIRPAAASADWTGTESLARFQVYRSGTLYIALPAGSEKPGWMETYEASDLTIGTEEGSMELYEKRVENGSVIELGAADAAGQYIPIYKTSVIDLAPPVPSVTKFNTSDWDAGWYRMETNLQPGTCIYSIDYDPDGSEGTSENAEDYAIDRLPRQFIGCDYIISRKLDKRDIYFFAEQDIEVYAAVVSSYAATEFAGWEKTRDVMTTGDGTEYSIYKKDYAMGETVLVDKLNDGNVRNFFLMVLPARGKAVSNALTDNPVIPEGERSEGPAPDDAYRYYLNDVFNLDTSDAVPTGYAAYGTDARNTVSLTANQEQVEAGVNLALHCPYQYNTINWEGSPVDGSVDSYWASKGMPGILTVDLQSVMTVNRVGIKIIPRWGTRTQNLEIQGSRDGVSYETLVPAADYEFVQWENAIELPFADTEIRYLRVYGTSNTGDQGIQVSELEAYGPAQTRQITNRRQVSVHKTVWDAPEIGITRTLETPAAGQVILETRVKSSAGSQQMDIPMLEDAAGRQLGGLVFGRNGYIQAASAEGYVDIVPYTADTWYTVKLAVDMDAGTYDVWVNHLRKAQDIPFAEHAENLQTVRYAVRQYSDGMLQIDYVKLYDNTEIYLVEENFNSLATGSQPETWQAVNGEAAVAEVPFRSDKSLMLENTGTPVQASRQFDPVSGDLTVEAKVKPVESGWVTVPVLTDAEGRVAAKVAFYRNSFFISNGDNWVYVCDQEVPNNYYCAGNWFHIKLVLNTDTKRYDFYVDGAKRYGGASFAEDVSSVSCVSFGAEQENTLYVDQVKVYDSASLARGLMPEEHVYNVKDFGAVGDGVTDDTEAIAKAIKAAAYTGGTVLLENGVFYTGQITLESDMTLFIDPSAEILANMDRNVYNKVIPSRGYNANHQLGRGIIYFEDATNVKITGGGAINGNGFYAFNQNDPSNQRPCILYFAHSADVTVENVRMVQSPFWTLVPFESENITIRNVSITNHVAPNRDGIDPVNSSNVTVENCFIIAGDDAFCPKSGNDIPSCNVDVRNVYMQSYCNGIKFGTDSVDDFRNYHFEDIWMKGVGLSGITLQAVDGSDMENISFKRVDMNNVDNVLFFCVGNRYRMPSGVDDSFKHLGRIRDITIEDLNYTNPLNHPYCHRESDNVHEAMILGLDPQKNTINDGRDHRISNVLFKNVNLEMPGGYTTVPGFSGGIGSGYPEHTSVGESTGWAYTIRWADNIRFENCTNTLQNADVRQEIARADYSEEAVADPAKAQYVLGLPDLTVMRGTLAADIPFPETAGVLVEDGRVLDAALTGFTADAAYDPAVPGVYTFTASLGENEDIAEAGSLQAQVRVVVRDSPFVTAVENPADITVPYGTLAADLPLPQQAAVQLSDGSKTEAAVHWNTDAYRPDQAGTQTLIGQLEADAAYENLGGYTAAVNVTVEEPEQVCDKTALQEAISQAEALYDTLDTYAQAAVKEAFRQALEEARTVNENPNATQAQADEAAEALQAASGALLASLKKGDANRDGSIDIQDVMAACRILARNATGQDPTTEELETGDMDGDNRILIQDIMSICRVLARQSQNTRE
ncbi:MAG TPA: discoidin domain-containing protein [Firmicutes bacterium]|nr:discoidin domain-containing protein [Bacillota bacterium]